MPKMSARISRMRKNGMSTLLVVSIRQTCPLRQPLQQESRCIELDAHNGPTDTSLKAQAAPRLPASAGLGWLPPIGEFFTLSQTLATANPPRTLAAPAFCAILSLRPLLPEKIETLIPPRG